MATTKTTRTTKTQTQAPTQTEKQSSNDDLKATITALQKEVATLRTEVATLTEGVKTGASTPASGDEQIQQLQKKIASALTKMGVRQWQLRDAGLI